MDVRTTFLVISVVTITTFVLPVLSVISSDNDDSVTGGSCYCLAQTIEKISNPVSAIFYMDGNRERMLVVEQRGVVSRYDTDGSKIDTFLDITDRVMTSGDFGESRGLLSFVLDPLFDVNKNTYAYYIRKDEGRDYAYVSMFQARNGIVDPLTEKFLMRIYQPFKHGNGGPMLFGDDGYLYIFTGDGGENDDPKGRVQDLNSFYGKVLRIDVRKQEFTKEESGIAKNYAVPVSNPFVNKTSVKEEVFGLGIRNMWGCSQDSVTRRNGTGRIFCAETGTNKYDEIDIIESGRNYGWNLVEGTTCRTDNACSRIENEGRPIFEFRHTSAHALVGGYVYRGERLIHMIGSYIFGDVLTSKTYFLTERTPGEWLNNEWKNCESDKCSTNARESKLNYLLGFAQDRKGELYLLMTDSLIPTSDDGKILRLVPPNSLEFRLSPFPLLLLATQAIMVALVGGIF